jgi:hypothetical protein
MSYARKVSNQSSQSSQGIQENDRSRFGKPSNLRKSA